MANLPGSKGYDGKGEGQVISRCFNFQYIIYLIKIG